MKILFYFLILSLTLNQNLQSQESEEKTKLLIRCDDIGMSHSVNMAAKELIESGLPFSASVMIPCAWYQEGVELLKSNPQITAGIHLTLNAEWKNYRWGPVAGKDKVPSLVDEFGYFFPSRAAFFANNPRFDEVEIELREQINRAINSGLNAKYLDYHMGTAVDTPELRNIVEKLAKEYGLAISRYFEEVDTKSMYSAPIESKKDSLFQIVENLKNDKINLLVCHIAKDNDEMRAMIDMNTFGLSEMSRHRDAELNALIEAYKNNLFEKNNIQLINYDYLIENIGLENMKSPLDSGY